MAYVGPLARDIFDKINKYLDTLILMKIIKISPHSESNEAVFDVDERYFYRTLHYSRKIGDQRLNGRIHIALEYGPNAGDFPLFEANHCLDQNGNVHTFPITYIYVQENPVLMFHMWFFQDFRSPYAQYDLFGEYARISNQMGSSYQVYNYFDN